MGWWGSSQAGDRAELLAGALELTEQGWPVVPGTYWQVSRWTGFASAPQSGPVPMVGVDLAGSLDPRLLTRWWDARPYSVLLPTGGALDAIEVSALVGRRLCARLDQSTAVAVGADGRWWFAVRAGEALRPELASRADVTLHGRGSRVVAPPTGSPRGAGHWRVRPPAGQWKLPEPFTVQQALLDVLGDRPALASAAAGLCAVATGVRS